MQHHIGICRPSIDIGGWFGPRATRRLGDAIARFLRAGRGRRCLIDVARITILAFIVVFGGQRALGKRVIVHVVGIRTALFVAFILDAASTADDLSASGSRSSHDGWAGTGMAMAMRGEDRGTRCVRAEEARRKRLEDHATACAAMEKQRIKKNRAKSRGPVPDQPPCGSETKKRWGKDSRSSKCRARAEAGIC